MEVKEGQNKKTKLYMKNLSITLATTSLATKLTRCSPLRRAFFLTLLMLGCLALSPAAQSAPKDNTSLGSMALSKTTGTDDTALGFQALPSNTTGSFNSATGSQALFNNTTGLASTAVGFQALYS